MSILGYFLKKILQIDLKQSSQGADLKTFCRIKLTIP
jgi:hypothetical protein